MTPIMSWWPTVALIACPVLFAVRIEATGQHLTSDTISSPKSTQAIDESHRLEKRASFMPSRGKKENEMDGQFAPDDKRAAFMAMRGRKDGNGDQRWFVGNDDDKRAGFMPMRGRKNSAYPSVNAADDQLDVYPVELNDMKRSAFIGMRGRKDDSVYDQAFGRPAYALPEPYRQSAQTLDNTNWMEGERSVRPLGSGPDIEKKANAFFAGRGKRSVNDGHDSTSIGQSAHESNHKHNEDFYATRG